MFNTKRRKLKVVENCRHADIAVIGASTLFPGSQSNMGFWNDILSAKDLLTEVPATHWLIDDYYDPDQKKVDKTYGKRGGFLDPISFDPVKWGIPPTNLEATDVSQLLALIVAQNVLQDALTHQFKTADRSRTSVILGVTSAQQLLFSMVSRLQRPVWKRSLLESGFTEEETEKACDRIAAYYAPWKESTFPGLLGNVVAGRVANRLNLGGTNCVIDAACASTFGAVAMAIQELQLGHSDLVLTGGVDAMNDIFMFMCFSKTPALSATGDCRPFSKQSDGTMLSEGVGMFALKRLEDAERDGDEVYGVIKSIGSSSDGKAKSVYAPVSEGQSQAIIRSHDYAGVTPRDIELIEAHGTGTKAGDLAEFYGLKLAFEGDNENKDKVDKKATLEKNWCALGSVKSQIGHSKAAAGAAGLFKVLMAVHQKVLPPSAKIDEPNPKLQIDDSPFYLNTVARPWFKGKNEKRRAGVSSFGFGGSNFHIILENYTGKKAEQKKLYRNGPCELFTFSSENFTELIKLLQEKRELLMHAHCHQDFLRMAYESSYHFKTEHACRLVLVSGDLKDLKEKLDLCLNKANPAQLAEMELKNIFFSQEKVNLGKVAVLFPGQGSQYCNMGREWAVHIPAVHSSMEASFQSLEDMEDSEGPLYEKIYPRPVFDSEEEHKQELELRETSVAQPGIGIVSLALWNYLQGLGFRGDYFAGHSFGELTALCAAGVVSEKDFAKIAQLRGMLMREAAKTSKEGGMLAVSCDVETLRTFLDKHSLKDIVIANYNAPRQQVLSGDLQQIKNAQKLLKEENIRSVLLPVSTAFHSPIVQKSVDAFKAKLKDYKFVKAKAPVFSGHTGEVYEGDGKDIKKRFAEQIARPIRYTDQIKKMYEMGCRVFLEVGPKSVLSQLSRKILEDKKDVLFFSCDGGSHQQGLQQLYKTLAQLAVRGYPVQFANQWNDLQIPKEIELKKAHHVYLNGTNYNKPFPVLDEMGVPKPVKVIKGEDKVVENKVNIHRPQVSDHVLLAAESPQNPINDELLINSDNNKVSNIKKIQKVQVMTKEKVAADLDQNPSASWLEVFREAQRQTAQVHESFHKSMSEAHAAYLRSTETNMKNLMSFASGGERSLPHANEIFASHRPNAQMATRSGAEWDHDFAKENSQQQRTSFKQEAAPSFASTNYSSPSESRPVMDQSSSALDDVFHTQTEIADDRHSWGASAGSYEATYEANKGTTSQGVDSKKSKESKSGPDWKNIIMEVVAEKTGYPESMLDLDMDLEGDLGIDSIKRVEIFSTIQEKAPEADELDNEEIAKLSTLRQIIDKYLALDPSVASETSHRSNSHEGLAGAVSAEERPVAAAGDQDMRGLLFKIVSEKTGYPESMLEEDMDLESDLGIDSIKRVEIFSSLSEQNKLFESLDQSNMASLKTFKDIISFWQKEADQGEAGSFLASAQASELEKKNLN